MQTAVKTERITILGTPDFKRFFESRGQKRRDQCIAIRSAALRGETAKSGG